MTELAERCERAEGPDRELDCLIGVAIGRFFTEPNRGWPDRLDYVENRDGGVGYPGHGFDQLVPRYTASIDAALTLAEGDAVDVMIEALRRLVEAGKGIDALARFTAASALRSRASTEGQTDG